MYVNINYYLLHLQAAERKWRATWQRVCYKKICAHVSVNLLCLISHTAHTPYTVQLSCSLYISQTKFRNLSVHPSVCPSICLSIYLSVHPSVCLSVLNSSTGTDETLHTCIAYNPRMKKDYKTFIQVQAYHIASNLLISYKARTQLVNFHFKCLSSCSLINYCVKICEVKPGGI